MTPLDIGWGWGWVALMRAVAEYVPQCGVARVAAPRPNTRRAY